jgi:hypothetical protein
MYLQHPDLAMQHAQQRVASLLEETEHDRLASRARAASAARRLRRRLSLMARAQPRQPVPEHAGAR